MKIPIGLATPAFRGQGNAVIAVESGINNQMRMNVAPATVHVPQGEELRC
jgi:hypothetical protein